MSTSVTMTLDEIERTPLTEDEIRAIRAAAADEAAGNTADDPDCPAQTKEELAQFRPWYELHPEQTNKERPDLRIEIDSDILEWFKRQGNGYRTKINAVLRQYAFG